MQLVSSLPTETLDLTEEHHQHLKLHVELHLDAAVNQVGGVLAVGLYDAHDAVQLARSPAQDCIGPGMEALLDVVEADCPVDRERELVDEGFFFLLFLDFEITLDIQIDAEHLLLTFLAALTLTWSLNCVRIALPQYLLSLDLHTLFDQALIPVFAGEDDRTEDIHLLTCCISRLHRFVLDLRRFEMLERQALRQIVLLHQGMAFNRTQTKNFVPDPLELVVFVVTVLSSF